MIGAKSDLRQHAGKIRRWVRSIGFKLFAAFLVSIVFVCAASGFVAYRISADALKRKMGDNMNQVVRDAGSNTDRWLDIMDGLFNQLAMYSTQNGFLTEKRRMLEPQTESEASEYKQLKEQLRALDEEIEQKSAAAGKATDSNERIKLNADIARASQIRNTLTVRYNELGALKNELDNKLNAYISAYVITNSDKMYSVGFIRFNGENQTYSTTGKKKTENLYETEWAAEAIAAKGKNVFLAPQTGSRLFDGEPGRTFAIAKSFWSPEDLKWADVLIIEFKMSFLENLLAPIDFGGIGHIQLIGESGDTLYGNRDDAEFGQPALASAPNDLTTGVSLEKRPWTLSGTIPEGRLLEDAMKIRSRLIVLLAGGAVLALLLGWWGYRMVGRPMLTAVTKMRQAEDGDLNVRLRMKRSDEIGSVSGSFDSMMERFGRIVSHTGRSADRLMQAAVRINGLVQRSRSASGEIAVAMNEVSSGAESLAQDAEKSSELTGEMTKRLEEVLSVNREMREVAREVEQSGRNGAEAIEELSRHNKEVERIISALVDNMERLRSGTESISVILDILGDIAKRINILSLNAAIVAASAGEAGRGFRVVSNEIGQLANQSKESIASVETVIETIRSDMAGTSQLLTDSLPVFERQSEVSRTSQHIFRQVETTMNQFIDCFQRVWDSLQFSMEAQSELAGTMMQVSAISEQSTAATENVAGLIRDQYESSGELVRTGEELEQLARELRQALEVFKPIEEAAGEASGSAPSV